VVKEGQESELGDRTGCIDGGRVGREVSQVFCTLFLESDETKTMQTKYLTILTYFDLGPSNHDEQKIICRKSCKITMKTKQEWIYVCNRIWYQLLQQRN